jgi:hypothetical protein
MPPGSQDKFAKCLRPFQAPALRPELVLGRGVNALVAHELTAAKHANGSVGRATLALILSNVEEIPIEHAALTLLVG